MDIFLKILNQNHERPVSEDEPCAKRRHVDKSSGQEKNKSFALLGNVIDLTEMGQAEHKTPLLSSSSSTSDTQTLLEDDTHGSTTKTAAVALSASEAKDGEIKTSKALVTSCSSSLPPPLIAPPLSSAVALVEKNTSDEQFKMADKALQEQQYVIKRQQAEIRWQRFLYYSNGEACPKDEATAYPFLTAAAQLDHVEARFTLAEWCRTGRGAIIAMLPTVAYTQYLFAATAGHTKAKYQLGLCLDEGFGCVKNIPQAMFWYKAAADDGLADAQHTYAYMLESEPYRDTNINLNMQARDRCQIDAVRYYTLAACQGIVVSQNCLGWCYFRGLNGIAKDENQAVEWFSIAAAQGNVFSQYGLGICFAQGKGITKDLDKAVHWLGKAADQGDRDAIGHLVLMFDQGQWGRMRNENKAFFWARKGALLGFASMQQRVFEMYLNGRGTVADAKEAFEWALKAAEQGLAASQDGVGMCYAFGRGVGIDHQKAFEWFTKAANQGNVLSMVSVAGYFETGRHTHGQVSLGQAIYWYRRAATANNTEAALKMGILLKNCNIPSLFEEGEDASKWFKQAAEQGNAIAQHEYACTIYNPLNAINDQKENKNFNQASLAYPWFAKAAEQKISTSQIIVACLLYHGQGVAKDESKAITWLRECINNPKPSNESDIPAACCNLSKVLELLPPSSDYAINKARIKEIIALNKRSVDGQHIPAIYTLATWYHDGKAHWIPKDLGMAIELYRRVVHLEKQLQLPIYINMNYTSRCNISIASLEKELAISKPGQPVSLAASHEAKDENKDKDKDLCKICYDRPIDCVLLNCGHLAVCLTCSAQIGKTCPMCRQPVAMVKAIYRS